MRRINATEFKARCLALLDEVERTGEAITITKRGKEVAQVLPAVPREQVFPQYTLRGTAHTVGDIVAPAIDADDWDMQREH